ISGRANEFRAAANVPSPAATVVKKARRVGWRIFVALTVSCILFMAPSRSKRPGLKDGAGCTPCQERRKGVCQSNRRRLSVSYTHLRAHETGRNLVCRLLL